MSNQDKQPKPVAWRHDNGPFARIAITHSKKVADHWKCLGWDITPLYEVPLSPVAPGSVMNIAISDVVAERQRQINAKGYTQESDDGYLAGVLSQAGAAYAVLASDLPNAARRAKRLWPWPNADKYLATRRKNTQRMNLVKAAALIVAEIERIDRSTMLDVALIGEGNKQNVVTAPISTDAQSSPRNQDVGIGWFQKIETGDTE
ncbi:hypothetical protein [Serratia liquefaciens]|uniref:hypothetical protein n=1 Tax=Serratia liquefaciens TaxID=614 RepID=UPI00217A011E|nr:hypothetical protein [Serratia liquefaciens]CAI1656159.1 Uncharacterised protein [Serratia liquefaciens]